MNCTNVLRPTLALAVVALLSSGCSHTPGDRLPSFNGNMLSYVLLQSEFYTQPVLGRAGHYRGDYAKARASRPDLVEFNGYATQYVKKPLPISVGNPVRVFVVNAGPSHFSAFHVIGTIMDNAYVGGNPANVLRGL